MKEDSLLELLQNKQLFKRIIKNSSDFLMLLNAGNSYHLFQDIFNLVFFDFEERNRLGISAGEIARIIERFPEHKEELLNILTENWEISCRLVNDIDDLHIMASIHKEYADQFFETMCAKGFLFKKIICNNSSFLKLKKIFPYYANEILNPVLENPGEFQRLIGNHDEWLDTADFFAERADELLNFVLENPSEFQRLIGNHDEWLNAADFFSERADELFNVVIENPGVLRYLVTNNNEWLNAADFFSERADELFNVVIENLWVFRYLIKNNHEWLDTADFFSEHADELFKLVLENPNEFHRLIAKNDEWLDTADFFSNHIDELLDFTLATPERLHHVVSNLKQFLIVTREFPKHFKKLKAVVLEDPQIFSNVMSGMGSDSIEHREYLLDIIVQEKELFEMYLDYSSYLWQIDEDQEEKMAELALLDPSIFIWFVNAVRFDEKVLNIYVHNNPERFCQFILGNRDAFCALIKEVSQLGKLEEYFNLDSEILKAFILENMDILEDMISCVCSLIDALTFLANEEDKSQFLKDHVLKNLNVLTRLAKSCRCYDYNGYVHYSDEDDSYADDEDAYERAQYTSYLKDIRERLIPLLPDFMQLPADSRKAFENYRESYLEMEKNVRVVKQSIRSPHSFFAKLNSVEPELNIKIISMTAGPKTYDEDLAKEIVKEKFHHQI